MTSDYFNRKQSYGANVPSGKMGSALICIFTFLVAQNSQAQGTGRTRANVETDFSVLDDLDQGTHIRKRLAVTVDSNVLEALHPGSEAPKIQPIQQPTPVNIQEFAASQIERPIAPLKSQKSDTPVPLPVTAAVRTKSTDQAPSPQIRDQKAWGFIGLQFDASGDHVAPNGLSGDPLLSLDASFNYALLRNKELYLFAESRIWVQ